MSMITKKRNKTWRLDSANDQQTDEPIERSAGGGEDDGGRRGLFPLDNGQDASKLAT